MFQPLLHQFTLIIGQGKGLYFTDNGQHPAFGKLVSTAGAGGGFYSFVLCTDILLTRLFQLTGQHFPVYAASAARSRLP